MRANARAWRELRRTPERFSEDPPLRVDASRASRSPSGSSSIRRCSSRRGSPSREPI